MHGKKQAQMTTELLNMKTTSKWQCFKTLPSCLKKRLLCFSLLHMFSFYVLIQYLSIVINGLMMGYTNLGYKGLPKFCSPWKWIIFFPLLLHFMEAKLKKR